MPFNDNPKFSIFCAEHRTIERFLQQVGSVATELDLAKSIANLQKSLGAASDIH